MIFAWIEERRSEYPLAVMGRVLDVARSGYYAWVQRPPSATAIRRDELAAQIRVVHAEMKGRYGSPRLTVELQSRGVACSVNLVAQVMKRHGIRAKTVRRFVRTTDSTHRMPVAENVLDREFTATKPNEKWPWTSRISQRSKAGCSSPSWWICFRGESWGGRWRRR